MRLCAEHIPFPVMQMVPHGSPSHGQAFRDGAAVPQRHEALCRVRTAVPSRLQPGEILRHLCLHGTPETENGKLPQKKAPTRTIRKQKSLILLALKGPVTGCKG